MGFYIGLHDNITIIDLKSDSYPKGLEEKSANNT